MQTTNLFEKTLIHHLYQEFQLRYRFKYVLPKLQEITLEGLKFDVSNLSTKIRNHSKLNSPKNRCRLPNRRVRRD